jgi:hypothetical protein
MVLDVWVARRKSSNRSDGLAVAVALGDNWS